MLSLQWVEGNPSRVYVKTKRYMGPFCQHIKASNQGSNSCGAAGLGSEGRRGGGRKNGHFGNQPIDLKTPILIVLPFQLDQVCGASTIAGHGSDPTAGRT